MTFHSDASILVPGDTSEASGVFVHERLLHPAPGSWTLLGGGSEGSRGKPVPSASGTLRIGCPVTIAPAHAPPNTLILFVASDDWIAAPFLGGMLWPQLTFVVPLVTDGSGQVSLTFPWPAIFPAIYVQFGVYDPAAGGMFWTLSNAAWGITL